MDTSALVVIDAQQEYFAPVGKVVLPDGPRAVERIAQALASRCTRRRVRRPASR